MVIPIHTSLAKMDHSLVEAAGDLGTNKFQTFTKVILKLSLPGVISGVYHGIFCYPYHHS